jgi:SAM-dependent methyltransferase
VSELQDQTPSECAAIVGICYKAVMRATPGQAQDLRGDTTVDNVPRPGFPPGSTSHRIYGLAIFSSAFLLFLLQPLIAKIILPRFGGTAAVWIVCLLFFQVVLLLGYLYAHLLARNFRLQTQGRIHAALLAASLLALPILPKSASKPTVAPDPVFHILALLGFTVGLPYFLLSSTSPLLQAWYTKSHAGAAPYRFYALSNLGSMLALASYPVLIEPRLSSSHQANGWSMAYAAVGVLCVTVALLARGKSGTAEPVQARAAPVVPLPDWRTQALWVVLAACGSALLLAITNHITQNVVAVPLLWVLPLSLYLLSFILCFDRTAWYDRGFFLRLLGVALGGMTYALAPAFAGLPIKVVIPLYCSGLFICCMFCHGELARLKPGSAHVTTFYLACSLGGAIGAAFVALLAPQVFAGYYELQAALGTCAILVLVVNHRDPGSQFYKAQWQPAWLVLVGLVVAIVASLFASVREQAAGSRLMVRNFYGVLRVRDETQNIASAPGRAPQLAEVNVPYRILMNGTIQHGLQFLTPDRRRRPTSYYGPESGIGVAIRSCEAHGPLRVGVIGLGAGTIASYGGPGDRYTFYELNPMVVQVANQQFSFLRDSEAKVDIVLGDARLSLEREPPRKFDVLAVDAFSGDSIPIHLLTREAFELYFRELKPDGILAVHVSNQYVDLQPVVAAAAAALRKEAVLVANQDDHPNGVYAAAWILLGSPQVLDGQPKIEEAGRILPPAKYQALWTDDRSGLFRLLK